MRGRNVVSVVVVVAVMVLMAATVRFVARVALTSAHTTREVRVTPV